MRPGNVVIALTNLKSFYIINLISCVVIYGIYDNAELIDLRESNFKFDSLCLLDSGLQDINLF